MAENKDSSVVTRLLEHAQQRPIEASFGEAVRPPRTLTPAMAPAPLARGRAASGSVAPPLSSLATTAPGRLAPPALPPRLPTHVSAFAADDVELLDDADFADDNAKTTEVDPSMIAAVRLLPTAPAPMPPPRAASGHGTARPVQTIEHGLQEMAAHRPATEDTNPGRRISRRASAVPAPSVTPSATPSAAAAAPLMPVLSPIMQPSPSVIVAPALAAPAHSQQVLRSVPRDAATAGPVARMHAGTGVVREAARPMRRATPWIAVGAAALLAGAVGAFLAMQADTGAARVVSPVAAPARPALAAVDIALNSIPPGAVVEVADGSTTRELGLTPLTTKLPVEGAVAITFRRDGFAPVTKAINPKHQRELSVALPPVAVAVVEPVVAAAATPTAPEPTADEIAAPAAPQAPAATSSRRRAKLAASAPAARAAYAIAPPAGQGATRKGLLSLGAKPPCDIYVDGKRTGLTTPQRDMVLPAGSHKITLVNKEFGIRESFTVQVEAGSERRVVKDLTKQIKR